MSSAGPGRREVAHRIFAAEYDDATLEYAESDEERAPNYVVLPSGARVNRLFVVGVLTAVEQVNEDTIRARIADPTGAFVVYAGQYQPDELAAFQSLEAPAFVAVTGKANTFSPEGSDRVLTSVRPESVTEIDAETRDRWVVATAEHTLARVQTAAEALTKDVRGEELRRALLRDGVEPGLAEGISKAIDHYDTSADYLDALRTLATQALEVVAGERSELEALDADPAGGDGTTTSGDLTGLLGDDRLAVTEAAGDIDPDAFLEEGAEGEDEEAEATETEGAADEAVEQSDDAGTASEEAGSTAAEPESTDETSDSEPVGDGSEADDESDTAPDDSDDETVEDGDADSGAEHADEESTTDEDTEAQSTESIDAESEEATSEAADDPATQPAEAASDEMYEMDEEEREEIEEEYGVDFQSGTEVDPAGEAGIETEDAPPGAGDDAATDEAAVDESTSGDTDGSETGGESEAGGDDGEEEDDDAAAAEDVDLEGVLLEEMSALDDGDGADREALIDAVATETGADADTVDDAIDDLLMSGQCYEPGDGTLKPI